MAYTSHGHHIPYTFLEDNKPEKVAECGGVRECFTCSIEAMPYFPAFRGERGKAYLDACSQFRNVTVAS